MDNFANDVTMRRPGAASLGARSPWANVAVVQANHALGQNPVLAAGRQVERHAAFRPGPAQQMAKQTARRLAQQAQSVVLAAELLPTTGTGSGTGTANVTVTRKPKNVHKTRINAGGYGAMGPHPERERLA